jgi:hypothetical protein
MMKYAILVEIHQEERFGISVADDLSFVLPLLIAGLSVSYAKAAQHGTMMKS